MKLDLDCKEVSRLTSQAQETELPPGEQARLRLHFVICKTCRNVEQQMDFLRRAMRQMGKDE